MEGNQVHEFEQMILMFGRKLSEWVRVDEGNYQLTIVLVIAQGCKS